MIAVDTNILVYAHRRDTRWHEPAALSLERLSGSKAPWAIPWPCIHEFLAIVTHPRIYEPASTVDAAIDQVDAWLESALLAALEPDREPLGYAQPHPAHGSDHRPQDP